MKKITETKDSSLTELDFEDCADYFDATLRNPVVRARNNEIGDYFAGCSTSQFQKILREGDLKAIPEIMELADRLDVDLEGKIGDPPSWENLPFGSTPIVPAYLAGHPCAMRYSRGEEPRGIKLWLNLGALSCVSTEALRRRAVTMAALAHCIARTRPVELYAAHLTPDSNRHGRVLGLRVCMGTSPFDAGRISVVAHPAFLRRFAFSCQYAQGCGYSIRGYYPNTPELKRAQDLIGVDLAAGDVWTDRFNHDSEFSDPESWVRSHLHQIREGEQSV